MFSPKALFFSLELVLMNPSFYVNQHMLPSQVPSFQSQPEKRPEPKAAQRQAGSIKGPGKCVAVTNNQIGVGRKLLFVQRADHMLTAGIYMAPYSLTSRLPHIPTPQHNSGPEAN